MGYHIEIVRFVKLYMQLLAKNENASGHMLAVMENIKQVNLFSFLK